MLFRSRGRTAAGRRDPGPGQCRPCMSPRVTAVLLSQEAKPLTCRSGLLLPPPYRPSPVPTALLPTRPSAPAQPLCLSPSVLARRQGPVSVAPVGSEEKGSARKLGTCERKGNVTGPWLHDCCGAAETPPLRPHAAPTAPLLPCQPGSPWFANVDSPTVTQQGSSEWSKATRPKQAARGKGSSSGSHGRSGSRHVLA